MAARTSLPEELTAGPFTVARARELAVSRGRLRNPELVSPTRGVRCPAPRDVDLLLHAHGFASALPDDVAFSHLTAARLHDLPTPKPWPGFEEPLHVMRDRSRPRVERRGCVHHKGLETRNLVEVHSLRATSPLDTWLHLAGGWSHPQLLAAADVLLRRTSTTPEELRGAAAGRVGRRHGDALVRIAAVARAGAASPGESLARWWFWQWGLPEPELNVPVLDEGGGWLSTSDFVWRRAHVVGEYDGDVHRTDRATWERDRERRAAIEDARWVYVEMTARSFSDGSAREALRRRLCRLLLA
jgi:hypothetical protein